MPEVLKIDRKQGRHKLKACNTEQLLRCLVALKEVHRPVFLLGDAVMPVPALPVLFNFHNDVQDDKENACKNVAVENSKLCNDPLHC